MNFTEVSEDAETIKTIRRVLADIGLDRKPEDYEGEGAYASRNAAAKALKDAIQKRHDAGERIAAPDAEIVQKAIGAARVVEKDRTRVSLTQTVIEMIIIGHVWMEIDGHASKHGALAMILQVMEKGMTAKRYRGLFDCGDCGGGDDCGSGGGGCGSCGGCGGHP